MPDVSVSRSTITSLIVIAVAIVGGYGLAERKVWLTHPMYRLWREIMPLILFHILLLPYFAAHVALALRDEVPESLGGGEDEILGLRGGLDEEEPVPVAVCLGSARTTAACL